MIQIITIENPFNPKIKEIVEEVYLGVTINSYVTTFGRDIFLNGRKISESAYDTTIPLDGQQIISIPHIAGGGGLGNILGFVATVALGAWAGAIIGGSGIFGYSLAANSIGAYFAAGAVMYLGGRLINGIFPQQINNNATYNDNQKSQTYGWDLPTVATQEGNVIGETYGTCIPQPQLLEEHIETVDGKQYLNLLYCGGYGPVDSIDNMRIDSTPIGLFDGVQLETRLGTNDQQPISFFRDTPTDQSIGLLLDLNKPLTRTTDSKKASALEITLEWPSGLYHLNDKGDYDTASMTFKIEYKLTGNADWIMQNSYTVSNASADAFKRSYKWNVAAAGQYDVRVTITDKPTGSRYMTYTQWSILTSYNSGVYSRPNKVLVGLRILATNQLSGGVPNLTWRQTRNIVYVWNPSIKSYESKAANNPIWAAYDILHGCRYLKNINTGGYEYVVSGCAHEHLDAYYDEWASAADYADEKIKNNEGEMECRYQIDAYYDTVQKRYDAATKAAAVGHAAIIIHGCNYGIVVDRPGTVCQIFGEGRTTVSSVSGSFLSRDERAKSIEITYNDADNDYKNTQFTLRANDYSGQDNTAQLTLFGVSRRSQAYREGVTALAASDRQLQTIKLSTDIDGITAEYGDIVGYTHAISKIGIASGRIVSATDTTVTLDKEVILFSKKTYEIYIQLVNDALIKREVIGFDETTNTLTMAQTFDGDKIPQQYDCYSFGETGKSIKPYRIVGAERDGDMLVKLKLIEYDEAVYATELDYSKYPRIDYSNTEDTHNGVTAAEETYMQRDGSIISTIVIDFETSSYYQKNINGYIIIVNDLDNNTTETYTIMTTHYIYRNAIAGHQYNIVVKTNVDGTFILNGKANITIIGKDTPPSDVQYLTVSADGDNLTAIIKEITDIDLNHYELRQGAFWENAKSVGLFIGNKFAFKATQNGTCTYWVKAIDNSGNESVNAVKSVINIDGVKAINVIYDKSFSADELLYTGMYENLNKILCLAAIDKIRDLQHFCDIFDKTKLHFSDGYIYTDIIDLGESVISNDCVWVDYNGVMHPQTKKRIKDLTKFSDIFTDGWELVEKETMDSTFSKISLGYDGNDDIYTDIQYRTSIDGVHFTDYKDITQTAFTGRYLQIQAYVKSISGHTQAHIDGVNLEVDVPDVEKIIENVSLSAGKNYIKYGHRFTQKPVSIALTTADSTGRAITWQMTDETNAGFNLQVYNYSNQLCSGVLVKAVIRGF